MQATCTHVYSIDLDIAKVLNDLSTNGRLLS